MMSMENRNVSEKNVFNWIEEKLMPKSCTSEEFIYNEMESQSEYSLPIIYQPFDASKISHWKDRGQLYDFLYSTDGEGKILLDFGPGDGWPSLIVAPYVKKVIGIDSSVKRIEVCTENAKRMVITNAEFIKYTVDTKLPFDDNTFDGIMAASSIEQTPDPKKTVEELYRVLKPKGRLRIYYEVLSGYRNGQEQDIWISEIKDNLCKIILYNRNIEKEYAVQYALTIAMSKKEVVKQLSAEGEVSFNQITVPYLEGIRRKIINSQVCKTIHPSGKTFVSWLRDIGFKKVIPTYNGGIAAAKLFGQYSDEDRPKDLASIDDIIKKVVRVAIQFEAPTYIDPFITAIK
ncbi:class I SAM-dependent methyltransferase [Sporanaerobacter sp. PP17-6a]|uniref:class I SAM-dependent methyltransferase n=1 Tax=Sporanaerobacter sp. PP17-6a TaxID=1891289 RepID=UPI0008A065C4|nr:class I SAM-dependent methyltransferase [Sporanaerobacter sp. PP17-6a]SCL96006.1 putative methyltransferase YcgJ [Sporanaerobacter sp. PP17-6a]